jgi:hypothetical protein
LKTSSSTTSSAIIAVHCWHNDVLFPAITPNGTKLRLEPKTTAPSVSLCLNPYINYNESVQRDRTSYVWAALLSFVVMADRFNRFGSTTGIIIGGLPAARSIRSGITRLVKTNRCVGGSGGQRPFWQIGKSRVSIHQRRLRNDSLHSSVHRGNPKHVTTAERRAPNPDLGRIHLRSDLSVSNGVGNVTDLYRCVNFQSRSAYSSIALSKSTIVENQSGDGKVRHKIFSDRCQALIFRGREAMRNNYAWQLCSE